jgi:DNA-binding NarL/FixJ family response regulator
MGGTADEIFGIDEQRSRWICTFHRVQQLSAREREVFLLLGQGLDNREIARTLEVAQRTVKLHITHVLRKLGLTSRLQAGVAAAEYALYNPSTRAAHQSHTESPPA